MPGLAATMRDVIWRRRGLGGWVGWLLLQPASGLFAAGVALRNLAYQSGVLQVHRAALPVVSVGNLSVGGTGKTPMTLWLARQLAAAGLKVGILLRGYAGTQRGVTVVSTGRGPEVDVDRAGDEAVMLARCFKGVVLTARQRVEGVAVAQQLGCQLVVLDDGFQHRALARDFDLVLVNGRSGGLLPAGPMRERRAALNRAHAVALVRKTEDERGPVDVAGSMRGGVPVFEVRFIATSLIESDGGRWLQRPIGVLSGRRIAVITGIADPAPFYQTVRQWETQIEEIFEFPDHHRYTEKDWQRLSRKTREIELIVTTEKDLVKLEHFPFARGKLVAVRVIPQVERADELLRLIMDRAGVTPTR